MTTTVSSKTQEDFRPTVNSKKAKRDKFELLTIYEHAMYRAPLVGDCILTEIIHQWDFIIVKSLLDLMTMKAGIYLNCICGFVPKKWSRDKEMQTEIEQEKEFISTFQLRNPRKWGKEEEKWHFVR